MTADKRIAVLADNAQSVAQVRSLVPGCPSSMVVATSRWRLSGLALEGAAVLDVEPLQQSAGAELLTRMIGDARTAREPDVVTDLVRLCDGLPLALSITGARLAMRPRWPLARMVSELADEQRRLMALAVDRDVSVSSVFDVSYTDLPVALARAYRWLALHPGPDISVELAAAILQMPVEKSVELLDALVDASLLAESGLDRYRFHDLVRLHARERAEQEDDGNTATEGNQILRRILEHYLDFAVDADLVAMPGEWRVSPRFQQRRDGPSIFDSPGGALDSMEANLPNLMAVLRAGGQAGLDELVWQLCEAMWATFLTRKHFADWIAAYRMGVEAAHRCGAHTARSRMHHRLGMAFHNLHQPELAFEQGEQAVAAARQSGHEHAESDGLGLVGMAERSRGRYPEAILVLQHAVELDHRAGRVRSEALARRRLGQTLHAAGHLPDAIAELTTARALMAALPQEERDEALIMVRLASVLTDAGRPAEAIELLGPAWSVLRDSGSSQYQGDVQAAWGEAAERLGDLDTALERLRRARDFYLDAEVPHVVRVQRALIRVEGRHQSHPDP
jgi:tetratricopeptide (TPR) repeat protein